MAVSLIGTRAHFLLLILFLVSVPAFASSWASVPNYFSQYSSFSVRQIGLGFTCGAALTNERRDDDFEQSEERPCNPALAPLNERHSTTADIAVGGDYSQAVTYAKYLSKDDKFKLAESILTDPSPTEFTGLASIGYTDHDFNVWLSPIHTYYFSELHNTVNPDVNLIAMREISLVGQYGHRLDKNWSVGLQVAGFDRKFVSVGAPVFDILADPDHALQTRNQTGLFLEPGVAFVMDDPWHFRISAMVRELGFLSETFDEVPMGTTVDAATGFTVPFRPSLGSLDFIVGFTGGPASPERTSWYRLSSTYRIGLLDAFVAYDPNEVSFGANVGFDHVRVGLMLQRLQIEERKNSVFSQVSYVF